MMYFLFGGRDVAVAGGMRDYIGGYDTIEKAKAIIEDPDDPRVWAHIAVLEDGTMTEPYGLRFLWRYQKHRGWEQVEEWE